MSWTAASTNGQSAANAQWRDVAQSSQSSSMTTRLVPPADSGCCGRILEPEAGGGRPVSMPVDDVGESMPRAEFGLLPRGAPIDEPREEEAERGREGAGAHAGSTGGRPPRLAGLGGTLEPADDGR